MLSTDTLDLRRITYAVFQGAEDQQGKHGRVVALTSPQQGEGVTYISQIICRDLANDPLGKTVYCSIESIANTSLEDDSDKNFVLNSFGYWTLRNNRPARYSWDFNPALRCAKLEVLRKHFDYVILDCASIGNSADIAGVATMVDAVLLVVSSGVSTKSQVRYAQQVIIEAGGQLQGCIFNRRKDPIPNAIRRIFGSRSR